MVALWVVWFLVSDIMISQLMPSRLAKLLSHLAKMLARLVVALAWSASNQICGLLFATRLVRLPSAREKRLWQPPKPLPKTRRLLKISQVLFDMPPCSICNSILNTLFTSCCSRMLQSRNKN